jgi:hypothetical protein
MKQHDFALKPFPGDGPRPAVQITGSIVRSGEALAVRYEFRGALGEVVVPKAAARPARRSGLWETTCCEFFLGVKGEARYWEFNLSPSGDWNVYSFTGYRQGMAEEAAFTALDVRVQRRRESLLLAAEAAVGLIVPANRPLEVGVAAVVQRAGGGLTYWALTHPGEKADFHRRDSFLVEI